MAKAPVAQEVTPLDSVRACYAVFGINEHLTLGLWSLDPDKLPEGHEAFMRRANDDEIAMARHLIKTLDA